MSIVSDERVEELLRKEAFLEQLVEQLLTKEAKLREETIEECLQTVERWGASDLILAAIRALKGKGNG